MQNSALKLPAPQTLQELSSRTAQFTGSVGVHQLRVKQIKTMSSGFPHLRLAFDSGNNIFFVDKNQRILSKQQPQQQLLLTSKKPSEQNSPASSSNPNFFSDSTPRHSTQHLKSSLTTLGITRQTEYTEQSERVGGRGETLPIFGEIVNPSSLVRGGAMISPSSSNIRQRSLPSLTTTTRQQFPVHNTQYDNSETLQFNSSPSTLRKLSFVREEVVDETKQQFKTSLVKLNQTNRQQQQQYQQQQAPRYNQPPLQHPTSHTETSTMTLKSTSIPLVRSRRTLQKSSTKPTLASFKTTPFELIAPLDNLLPKNLPIHPPLKKMIFPHIASIRLKRHFNDDFNRLSTQSRINYYRGQNSGFQVTKMTLQDSHPEQLPTIMINSNTKSQQTTEILPVIFETYAKAVSDTQQPSVVPSVKASNLLDDDPKHFYGVSTNAATNDFTITRSNQGFAHSKNDDDSDLETYIHLCVM